VAAPDRSWPGKCFDLAPGCVQRIALMVEYNGSHFHGWQRQASPDVATVQAVLESALSKVANHSVKVFCAGRTDAGVHAVAQIVHFDVVNPRSEKAWVEGTNSHMLPAVRVRWATEVSVYFHARYSALARQYQYYIYNNKTMSAVFHGQLTHYRHPLDVSLMHNEAQCLLGEKDFSTFRAAACQSQSPMRYVEQVSVTRRLDVVCIEIRANAFLLHMVRNVVGSLMAVGSGRREKGWIYSVLQLQDRTLAEPTARPDGLYLQKVVYPPEAGLPQCEQNILIGS